MDKKLRLRRKIDKPEEEETDASNSSPIPCVDCGKVYPLVAGASNIRCVRHNAIYKMELGGKDDWHTQSHKENRK